MTHEERSSGRPYFNTSTAAMQDKFDQIKGSRFIDDIIELCLFLSELHYRKHLKKNGKLFTPAGELYKMISVRLDELDREGFAWPSTEAPSGDGSLDGADWNEDSPLSRMRYSVAADGPSESQRRQILTAAFKGPIPTKHKEEEIWGDPGTAARLYKIAQFLATLVRNNKRKRKPPLRAIGQWEGDVAWLKRSYYDGTSFSFQWPMT